MHREKLILKMQVNDDTEAENTFDVYVSQEGEIFKVGHLEIVNGHVIEHVSLEESVETEQTLLEYLSQRRLSWDVYVECIF